MDMFEDETPGNAPEFTVSEISGAVKRVIEGEFAHVRIRGEIGRVSFPRSGHVYLDLKDDRAVISGVIWKGVASRLETRPEEGLEVVATGRLTTFPGQSRYQIVIEDLVPAGMGALMAMLEKRKKMLAAEGLFEEGRKKALPFLPEVIGVVTSPSGAVIRDILHRLRDRFPRKVLIWPVAVQGKNCAAEVARGIEGFNALTPGGALPRPDLLIVARGGGSIEDLWGFNEEIVARAAAASRIPLISAVGHETDTTLIDFVSDRRAPTPSAAAELAVPVRGELLAWTSEQGARLTRAQTQAVEMRTRWLRDLSRAMPRPEGLTEPARQRLDYLATRLPQALTGLAQRRRVELSQKGGLRPSILRQSLAEKRRSLDALSTRLSPDLLARRRVQERRELDRLTRQFVRAGEAQVGALKERLAALDRLRVSVGYEKTLERGYAVVRDGEGHLLRRRAEAEAAGALEIQFADGRLGVQAGDGPVGGPGGTPGGAGPDAGSGDTSSGAGKSAAARPKQAQRKPKTPPEQGSLF